MGRIPFNPKTLYSHFYVPQKQKPILGSAIAYHKAKWIFFLLNIHANGAHILKWFIEYIGLSENMKKLIISLEIAIY